MEGTRKIDFNNPEKASCANHIDMEEWRNIPGYEGIYQVSSEGRVKSLGRHVKHYTGSISLKRDKILKPQNTSGGYLQVSLNLKGFSKARVIHQLVAENFLNHKRCGMKLVINHINFNKKDNRAKNLEIVTQRKNTNQKHLKSSSKYVGVYWNKNNNKWRSSILIRGKRKALGTFINELEAHTAYQTELKRI